MSRRIGRWIVAAVLALSPPALADRRADRLRSALIEMGDVRHSLIDDAVTAAIGVEGDGVSAELLLALAWRESRLDPTVRPRGGRVCGALQVVPRDVGERDHADACRRWSRDTWQGFEAGAVELRQWLRHARGDLYTALRGRACGWKGLDRSIPCLDDRGLSKEPIVREVLRRTRMLERFVPRTSGDRT